MVLQKENMIVYTIIISTKEVDSAGNIRELQKLLEKEFEKQGLLKEARRIDEYYFRETKRDYYTTTFKVFKATKTTLYTNLRGITP